MSRPRATPIRVHQPHVEWLLQRLSERDWAILETVNRLHLATGSQLERLHFTQLQGRSRSIMRWRVLKRLVDSRALLTLNRRAGGASRGSAPLCFALDTAGRRLLQLRTAGDDAVPRVRRSGQPGERFVEHTLAVAELYVELTERTRNSRARLQTFLAEPAAWWPISSGGWLKPDAYVVLGTDRITDYWWYEADLATESLPTVRRKLLVYLDFVRNGLTGPDSVVPRVLVAVPTEVRRKAVEAIVAGLGDPADRLFSVTVSADASKYMLSELLTSGEAT